MQYDSSNCSCTLCSYERLTRLLVATLTGHSSLVQNKLLHAVVHCVGGQRVGVELVNFRCALIRKL